MDKTALIQALQADAKDTPYTITATDKGFRLAINIVDAKWYTLLYKNGLKSTFVIDAKLDESKKVAQTTDTLYQLEWAAGADAATVAPKLGAQLNVQKGEVISFQGSKQFGVGEDGTVGKTVDYTFSSNEAKSWLRAELEKYGWKRGLGTEAKGALIVIGVIALLSAILFPLAFLLGWFNQ